eukprot:5835097-Pyramimonas_sp.AAC.1
MFYRNSSEDCISNCNSNLRAGGEGGEHARAEHGGRLPKSAGDGEGPGAQPSRPRGAAALSCIASEGWIDRHG